MEPKKVPNYNSYNR